MVIIIINNSLYWNLKIIFSKSSQLGTVRNKIFHASGGIRQ